MKNNVLFRLSVALIVVVALVVAINIWSNLSGVQIRHSYSVPSYFSSAVAYGKDDVIMSNNQVIESYNYLTGATTPITPSSGLENIDSLSASSNDQYLLFHQTVSVSNSTLNGILTSDDLDPDNPFGYWWVYNVSNKTFQPIPNNALIAKFNGNNMVDALQSSNAGEQIVTYNPSNMTKSETTAIIGSANFFPTANGFLLESPEDGISYTTNGIVNEPIAQGTVLIGVDYIKQLAVGVESIDNQQQLIQINLKDYSTKVIAIGITNQPVWLSPDSVLYTTTPNINSATQLINSFDLSSGNNSQWKLSGGISSLETEGIKPIAFIGPSTAVISQSTASYYLIGGSSLIKPAP